MRISKTKQGFSLIELSIVILVIGILVIGITKGKRIISQSKISSAQSVTASSPVSSISNLVLWLETTSNKSFDSSDKIDGGSGGNGTITTWYNINPQGVNLRNVSQGTASQKPTYIINGINGIPSLIFDGSSDYLGLGTILNDFINSSYAVFIVEKRNGNGYLIGPNNGQAGLMIGYRTSLMITDTHNYPGTGWYLLGIPVTAEDKKPKIITFAYDALNTKLSAYLNGSFISNNTSASSIPSSSGGNIGVYGGEYYNGQIGEIIMFNKRLTSSEIDSIHNYLKTKWGI